MTRPQSIHVANGSPRWLFPRRLSLQPYSAFSLRAFSLIEVMIAMIILGLGMVMAATIFPVGWQTARTLSEHTVRQSAIPAAQNSIASLVPASGPSFTAVGFAGDLIYDADHPDEEARIVLTSDTRVHALHLQNIQVEDQQYVPENPWDVERIPNLQILWDNDIEMTPGPDPANPPDAAVLYDRSYDTPQILFHQRTYPPMPKRIIIDPDGLFGDEDEPANWDDILTTRKFCWGILHRLRDYVGPNPNAGLSPLQEDVIAQQQIGSSRTFDVYYFLLRKPNPTFRFALQDPQSAPLPDSPDESFTEILHDVAPTALPEELDVMFPVAWRVEIQFGLLNKTDSFTGVPTEITIPPPDFPGNAVAALSFTQMFRRGTQFVDELSGMIYKVARRREIGFEGDADYRVILTLDREIFIEDIDLPASQFCEDCLPDGKAKPVELVRTVWIYPPPVDSRDGSIDFPTFKSNQPVVSIDVRTLTIPASE